MPQIYKSSPKCLATPPMELQNRARICRAVSRVRFKEEVQSLGDERNDFRICSGRATEKDGFHDFMISRTHWLWWLWWFPGSHDDFMVSWWCHGDLLTRSYQAFAVCGSTYGFSWIQRWCHAGFWGESIVIQWDSAGIHRTSWYRTLIQGVDSSQKLTVKKTSNTFLSFWKMTGGYALYVT